MNWKQILAATNYINKLQLDKYEAAPNFIQLSQNLTSDFCVFTCFSQFLHDVVIKFFCFDLQNNIMITSWKNW